MALAQVSKRCAGSPRETDEELLERIQGDDTVAFGMLYDRHCAEALRLAQIICTSIERGEEAVQDAFLAAWRSRAQYDPARGTPKTWILALTRHRSIDLYRRDSREGGLRASEDLLEIIESLTNVEDDASQRDEASRVRASLRALPDMQREVIVLAYFGGMTHAEIEQRLHLPLGTVKGRMRLGMRRLAAEIELAAPIEQTPPQASAA